MGHLCPTMKAAILTIFGLTAAEGLNDPFQDEQTINREFIELENLQEGDIKGYLPHKKLRGFSGPQPRSAIRETFLRWPHSPNYVPMPYEHASTLSHGKERSTTSKFTNLADVGVT